MTSGPADLALGRRPTVYAGGHVEIETGDPMEVVPDEIGARYLRVRAGQTVHLTVRETGEVVENRFGKAVWEIPVVTWQPESPDADGQPAVWSISSIRLMVALKKKLRAGVLKGSHLKVTRTDDPSDTFATQYMVQAVKRDGYKSPTVGPEQQKVN